jgi:hypothetical protein
MKPYRNSKKDGKDCARLANFFEDTGQRVFFVDGGTQRMKRVDTGDRERGGLDLRTLEGFDVIRVRLAPSQ